LLVELGEGVLIEIVVLRLVLLLLGNLGWLVEVQTRE
jgi:hypothetical protein